MPPPIGFLSTYPPTPCGIATFTASLRAQLLTSGSPSGVVRLVDAHDVDTADVLQHLLPGSYAGQVKAAAALDAFDVAVIQHEFGIYGGVDGDDVLGILDWLTVPTIVVLHTVLSPPTAHQREILERLADRADAVITMTNTARDRLLESHRVAPAKVVVIPHGAPDPSDVAAQPTTPTPPTMLTWGLLGPGKGIEAVIDVLPDLRRIEPRLRYTVAGQTHPRVFDREGEAYRHALMARAAARGVADMMDFDDTYLDAAALQRVVADADVVVLPYESTDQVTSGVLIEAVAAGKPVVATAFPRAVELLTPGAGLVVPHGDPAGLAEALRRVLVEPGLAASMSRLAGAAARDLRWSSVAARYLTLAEGLVARAGHHVGLTGKRIPPPTQASDPTGAGELRHPVRP